MNQRIKQQWVAALRSGDYQQTTGELRNGSGFCCLGVLTDLYLKEVGVEWMGNDEDGFMFPKFNEEVLPYEVMDWADLGLDNPEVTVERFSPINVPLSYLNDTDHDFKMIATLIEEQL